MNLQIRPESADQPDVCNLLAESDAYYASLYPSESNHLVDVNALTGDGVEFLVARDGGTLCGFGALLALEEYGEIKRMFVAPAARGRQLGKAILAALLEKARAQTLPRLCLETGCKQQEAIGLYRSAGFIETAPFGNYRPDPLSIFMEKRLAP